MKINSILILHIIIISIGVLTIVSCTTEKDYKIVTEDFEIEHNFNNFSCGTPYGIINENNKNWFYQINIDNISFFNISNPSEIITQEIPSQYKNTISRFNRIYEIIPISINQTIFVSIDKYDFLFTLYSMDQNIIDTICSTNFNSEKVLFPIGDIGNINYLYHPQHHKLYIESIDMSVSQEDSKSLNFNCIYEIDLKKKTKRFLNFKFPKNYSDRLLISGNVGHYMTLCNENILTIFSMDESVNIIRLNTNSSSDVNLENFDHSPIESTSFDILKKLNMLRSASQKSFKYNRCFYTDRNEYYYRFYHEPSTDTSKNNNFTGVACYNNEGKLLAKKMLDDIYNRAMATAIATKDEILCIKKVDIENKKIIFEKIKLIQE